MTETYFVDTNVLVYFRDTSEKTKQKAAEKWMSSLYCQFLLTEDISNAQKIDNLTIINPFLQEPE